MPSITSRHTPQTHLRRPAGKPATPTRASSSGRTASSVRAKSHVPTPQQVVPASSHAAAALCHATDSTPTPRPPAPPVLNDVEAVALALRGEPVKLSLGEERPQALAIRELIPRGDQRAFEIAMGGRRFEVLTPGSADPQAKLARLLPMIARVPVTVRDSIRRLTLGDAPVEHLSFTAELQGREGGLERISVRRQPGDGKQATYTIADRNGSVDLVTTPDEKDIWEVAQTFDLWAQIPPALRGALRRIKVEDTANPTDEAFAKQYNKPDFVSAASGGNGEASFWHGTQYLREDVFLHEFGHVLGQRYSSANEFYPDGWAEAVRDDRRAVTEYGETTLNEDFAEFFWFYMKLRNGRAPEAPEAPTSMAELAARYPSRTALMDKIFRGEMRPKEQ